MEHITTIPPSNLLYDQESLSLYRAGGYHPVCLGDTFKDGRYRVVHKLGWGGFSTVWLAKDGLLDQWVALKIGVADSKGSSRELATLQKLQQHGGQPYAVRLVDSFVHVGPNGSHQCIVTELLGPSVDTVVADYVTGGERLDVEVILKIAKQVLEAVSSVHRAGYAHGDLSGSNIAFTASQLKNLSEEEILEVIGHPHSVLLSRKDGKPLEPSIPKQLVRKASWEEWIDEDEEDIRFIDWGEAFKQGAESNRLAQPGDLRAPEILFTGQFDYRVDLWRVGCTIYSLIFAARPFMYLGDDDVLIHQMIDFVEPLPTEWHEKWELIQGSSRRSRPEGRHPSAAADSKYSSKLECRFHEMVKEPELMPVLAVIRGLMRFLPSERISADEALRLLES